MYSEFKNCKLCPRECGVDRTLGQKGFCGGSALAEVSRISLHFMEEPVISGKGGSGTVFFSHCTLGCIYCQNFEISRKSSIGNTYNAEDLAKEYLKLEKMGANNINLVTPTHYMPIIKESCIIARNNGLKIPFVYNTSGFEKKECIESLKGVIDIFLTDLKYFSPYLSKRYSSSVDYYDFAKDAITAMTEITGKPRYNSKGMLIKGTVIRHLLLPGQISDTIAVLRKIAYNWADKIILSLMRQYTPISQSLTDELSRAVTDYEYNLAKEEAELLGLEGFLQDSASVGIDKIPDWNIKAD